MRPPAMVPGGRMRLRRLNPVTDLPQPLSPSTASVPPRAISKSMPLTARTSPPSVRNSVTRPSTDISGAFSVLMRSPRERIGGITQSVADKVEGDDGEDDEYRRIEQPGQLEDHLDTLRLVEQQAPAGHRRLDAEAEEAERGFAEDHRGDGERRNHQDVAHRSRQQVLDHDTRRRGIGILGGAHEIGGLE